MKAEAPKPQWETVPTGPSGEVVLRLSVPGGWLYRLIEERALVVPALPHGVRTTYVSVPLGFVPQPKEPSDA